MQAEALTLYCYGVVIHVLDEAGLGLCQRLRESLPPEFIESSEQSPISVAYQVTATSVPGESEASEILICCDEVAVFATDSEDEAHGWLRWDIEQTVARRAPQLLFVHAAVIGWRGVGIVIPGRATIGKTSLAIELVRRGAVYYSDTFAVLDDQGMVHPYRRAIGPPGERFYQDLRLLREDGAVEPLPIRLIVSGAYSADSIWQPIVVRGPQAALPLVDSTVLPREQATLLPQVVAQLAASAVGLRGTRSEAEEVAALLLDIVDDALVSRALDAAGDNQGRLADDLGRVSESRLQSPNGRNVSPPLKTYNPFNGDSFVEAKFRKLTKRHSIKTIIETGTFMGDTTPFLATIVPSVVTIELNERWDHRHLLELPNVICLKGDSGVLVRKAVEISEGPFLFFLDAHGFRDTPTPHELATIAKVGITPVIVIHDFKVPGTKLGYDIHPDFTYDWDHIKDLIEAIYGKDRFTYYYNDEHSAEGARRGVIYIEPQLKTR